MNKKKKLLLGGVILLLAALIAWTVSTLPEVPETNNAPSEKSVMTYNGNTLSAELNGKKQWEATAEKIEMDIETHDAVLTNMDAKFYTDDGRVLELKVPRARYIDKTKDLEAEGGVTGSSTDGAKLKCDKIHWIADNSLLALIDNVELERDSDHVKATGDRMESKDGFAKFKITGHAHLQKGN